LTGKRRLRAVAVFVAAVLAGIAVFGLVVAYLSGHLSGVLLPWAGIVVMTVVVQVILSLGSRRHEDRDDD
jgi:hypothetical protein